MILATNPDWDVVARLVTNSFTHYADQLAARGFLAGCVDLYDGHIATTQAEVKALRSASRREPMNRTIDASQ